MSKYTENRVLVQIGTHTGVGRDDPFIGIAKTTSPSKVILVEPNILLNNMIWENYKGVKNVILENVAITKEENRGIVKLVYPKSGEDGVSVNGYSYGDHNFSLLPMDDWGDNFEVLEVPSMSFNELCEKHKIDHIYYLQIDTEGYDSEIIKSIDFDKIEIDTLRYEVWPFGKECFRRYGKKAKFYGKHGGQYVRERLQRLGYDILEQGRHDMLAVKI